MFPTVDAEDISQVTSLKDKEKTLTIPRDAQDSPEGTQETKSHNNRELSLNMLIKEMVFCIALALTTYGALHNTSSKVSKHPQAVRFFKQGSIVKDWYRGELSNALAAINLEDVSFVMYYAPWDAECQYVRGEFEKAASIMGDRVHFSAINCWNPESECRLQHNKIPSWPILMAYTITSRGVLYKGPKDVHSMVKFLELIIKPLERVSSMEDLVYLLSTCDAVAVGYTPIVETSRYYNIWYHVAVKAKEFDVVGELCFAAVTSEDLATDLGVDRVPCVRLMLWNDTKEFVLDNGNDTNVWNESFLVRWVLENFTQPVARIIPMWKKAFSFERYVDGPFLMLFTPLNPLYDQHPVYALMREIAMEYHNCDSNESFNWTSELMKLQQVQRLIYQQKNYMKFCQEYKFKKPFRQQDYIYRREIVSHNNKYPWNNTTQKQEKSSMINFLIKRGLAISKAIDSSDGHTHFLSSIGILEECSSQFPTRDEDFYENYGQCQTSEDFIYQHTMEKGSDNSDTTMLPHENDPLAAENLIQSNVKHFCNIVKFAHELGPPVLPAKVSGNITHINGLACKQNFSLNMMAIDSVRNHHFAESLGIDITNKTDMTALVILDTKNENQYVLAEEFSAKSVRDFIYNFTMKRLKRTLRSRVDGAYTHSYSAPNPDHDVRIIELTTKTFRKVVRTPGTVTLVAVCGGGCCAATSRALCGAVRLLRTCGVRAQAARLDALRHDLPWSHTAHAHPTLLVYNGDRWGEAECRRYPLQARLSMGGVVALALRALPAPRHLRVRIALCRLEQGNYEKKSCLSDIREHISSMIGRNLRYYRRTEDRSLQDALFKRLQHLHQVALQLSVVHVTDLTDKQTDNSLLSSLESLSDNWEIDISFISKDIKRSSTKSKS